MIAALSEHLRTQYPSHLAAAGGATMSLLNGQAVFQSFVVGMLIYIATNVLRIIATKSPSLLQRIKNWVNKW